MTIADVIGFSAKILNSFSERMLWG